ncbi:MAG: hypothetical protein R3275_04500 [Saprospiraceae bacterium]|nr:hypothetical protein [Saprospiraceae bacterium]
MNYKYFFLSVLALGLAFTSCNKDEDDDHDDMFGYHAHIHSPNGHDKFMGDTIDIIVNFEDHHGGTVHHINVRIFNKATDEEIYDQPADAHVHAVSGAYEFSDRLVLSEANGVTAHSDWIMEAKLWGQEAGVGEEVSILEFHVHPK